MKGQIKPELRKKRNRILTESIEESAKFYRQKFIGKKIHVLWESTSEMGEWGWKMEGYAENYLRVNAFASSPRWNEVDRVLVEDVDGDRMKGVITKMG